MSQGDIEKCSLQFSYYLCNFFSKIPGKQLLQGQYESINSQSIVLDQGNISDSLWFVGLIYCLEDCGLETFLYLTGSNSISS